MEESKAKLIINNIFLPYGKNGLFSGDNLDFFVDLITYAAK